MKKIWIIASLATMGLMVSCNKVRRGTGRAYMPDMYYSRAYETYASTEKLRQQGINYSAMPVAGTIARNDLLFTLPYQNDTTGGYIASKSVVNPLPPLDAKQYLEAARLYLVNCAICHGEKLDGLGPLWNGGAGPYLAAPKNLVGDEIKQMAEGTMFHSITYGRNMMGSYASQLSTTQRWMIIHYIKEKQSLSVTAGKDSLSAAAPADTTTKNGK